MKERYSSNVERKSFYSWFVFKNYFESCLKVKLPRSTEYGLKEHSNVSGQPFPWKEQVVKRCGEEVRKCLEFI